MDVTWRAIWEVRLGSLELFRSMLFTQEAVTGCCVPGIGINGGFIPRRRRADFFHKVGES